MKYKNIFIKCNQAFAWNRWNNNIFHIENIKWNFVSSFYLVPMHGEMVLFRLLFLIIGMFFLFQFNCKWILRTRQNWSVCHQNCSKRLTDLQSRPTFTITPIFYLRWLEISKKNYSARKFNIHSMSDSHSFSRANFVAWCLLYTCYIDSNGPSDIKILFQFEQVVPTIGVFNQTFLI